MHEYYFTFRSITTAQRARELLRRQKLPGVLLRTPKAMALQGCGHSLRVPAGAAMPWRSRRTRCCFPAASGRPGTLTRSRSRWCSP